MCTGRNTHTGFILAENINSKDATAWMSTKMPKPLAGATNQNPIAETSLFPTAEQNETSLD